MMSVYRKRCLCMSFLTIFRQLLGASPLDPAGGLPSPDSLIAPLAKIPAGVHGAPTFFLNRARLGVNPALYIRPILSLICVTVILYFVCIPGSVQYSWSHCPVLLYFHLHFQLFFYWTDKDGWMDG